LILEAPKWQKILHRPASTTARRRKNRFRSSKIDPEEKKRPLSTFMKYPG